MRSGSITQALIDAYEHPRIRLTIGGTTVTEDHIGAGSFSIRAGASGGMLEPGGCVVASCQFSILDFDEELTNLATAEGTEVIVEAGYGESPTNATYDRIGTFYVSSVTLHQFVTTYLCYDGLKRGDEAQWTSYAFPMTVNQIIASSASDAGLTVSQLPTAGGDITVDLRDADGNQPTLNITCRQALVKALEISGNFGFMDANGQLKCGWYSWNAAKSYDWDSYFGADFNALREFTGVQVSGGAITGTADYLYTLPENIFVTDDNRADITARLATALIGHPFVSGSFGVFADPRVEPGDCIQISFKRLSGTITGLLPVAALTFKGSLQMALGCDSESTDELKDLRETATERSTNAATTADVAEALQEAKDYTDQHGGSGNYIATTDGTGYGTELHTHGTTPPTTVTDGVETAEWGTLKYDGIMLEDYYPLLPKAKTVTAAYVPLTLKPNAAFERHALIPIGVDGDPYYGKYTGAMVEHGYVGNTFDPARPLVIYTLYYNWTTHVWTEVTRTDGTKLYYRKHVINDGAELGLQSIYGYFFSRTGGSALTDAAYLETVDNGYSVNIQFTPYTYDTTGALLTEEKLVVWEFCTSPGTADGNKSNEGYLTIIGPKPTLYEYPETT